eukprot:CAMPEP_0181288690 /NCGR_PEP_ID=MMETSP1101-20121128/472_1 /TAXON_ID=46948 /ORGANISM="Rhodomonas abbreviata, Strain Caron Lab Isolate" /LENGTH=634 /DNA_ID=CAMNT_0023392839 /DNA_START=190 /DNA_END=2091 /DNA_ORIENTATION=-
MELSGFKKEDIQLVAELYRESTFAVENEFGTTAPLPVRCGVKQGDIISPTVFTITMNVLLRRLAKVGNGYMHSSGREYNVLAFADDLCILTESAEKMQMLVDQVVEFADWSGMWVNVGKSEITAYDFSNKVVVEVGAIRYKGKAFKYLHPKRSYKYLGFHVTMLQNWEEHKAQVVAKIETAMESLRDTMYLPTQVEEMVRMCVIPLFRYSAALVPWTKSELADLSTKFGIAVKGAWKVTNQCGRPILTADTKQGGLNAPLAESLVVQERWGVLQQGLAHNDDIKQLIEWRLKRTMRQQGVETLKGLQMELSEGRSRMDSWISLLLRDMHELGLSLTSSLDGEQGIPSLSELSLQRRQELSEDIKSLVAGDKHKTDAIIQATLDGMRQERADIRNILGQLRGWDITRVDQIVGNASGDFARVGNLIVGGNNYQRGYQLLCQLVNGTVNKAARQQLYAGGQQAITAYFPSLEGTAPLPKSNAPRSELASWLEGPRAEGKETEVEIRERREGITLPYWDDRIAYDRLTTVVEISEDGRMARCRFRQTIPDGEKRIEKKGLQEVAEAMVRNRATLVVEDKSTWSCWKEETGFLKLRVDGYKRFRINRKKRFCFTGTIIDATDKEELGMRLDKGLPAWG